MSLVLDRSKVASRLWVRAVWAPEAGRAELPIALVTDRRRFMIGGVAVVVGFLVVATLAVGQAPLLLVILPLALSFIGISYSLSGRSGYYEVAEDGSLGDFLGRRKPDLSWMRLANTQEVRTRTL
jgi:hypothetical protein